MGKGHRLQVRCCCPAGAEPAGPCLVASPLPARTQCSPRRRAHASECCVALQYNFPCRMSELRVIHLLDDLCDAMSKYELFDDGNGTQRWALSGAPRSAASGPGMGRRGLPRPRPTQPHPPLASPHRPAHPGMWPSFLDAGSRFAGKNPSVEVTKQQRRELTNYCHDVLERWGWAQDWAHEGAGEGQGRRRGLCADAPPCPGLPGGSAASPPSLLRCCGGPACNRHTRFCCDRRHEDELSHALRNSLIDTDTASDFICLSTANHCNLSLAEEQAQEQAQAEEQAQEQAEEEQAEGAAAVDADGEAEAGEQPAEAAGTDGAVVDGSKEEL